MIHNDVLNQLQLLVKTLMPPLVEVAETPADLPHWMAGQKLPAHVLASLPNGRFQVSIGDHVLDMNLPKNTQPGEKIALIFVSDQPRPTFVFSREAQASGRTDGFAPRSNPSADSLARAGSAAEVTLSPRTAMPVDVAAAARNGLPINAMAAAPSGLPSRAVAAARSGLPGDVAPLGLPAKVATTASNTMEAVRPNETGSALGARAAVTLSDTARFLGVLMQKVAEKSNELQSSSLLKTAPLILSLPADSQELARILRSALSQSGLFYESHQAQWVAGERSLMELLREPQSKLSAAHSGNSPATDTLKTPAVSNAAPGLSSDPRVSVRFQESAPPPPTHKSMERVHPDTLPIIQQQLNTLDAHQMVWAGQIWPGQQMDWAVEERQGRGGTDEEAVNWKTKLRLQLPRLGNVSAALSFTPQGLHISLAATDTATVDALKSAQGKLKSSLDAARLTLLELTVERDSHA